MLPSNSMPRPAFYLLAFVGLLPSCDRSTTNSAEETVPSVATPFDGTYAIPSEVAPFFGEVLELNRGQFSYWHYYSDVSSGFEPARPVQGRYRIDGDRVVLEGADVESPSRLILIFGGQTILVREDSIEMWTSKSLLKPSGILIRTPKTKRDIDDDPRNSPSLQLFPKENVSEWW